MKRRWALWAECNIGARLPHDGMCVEKLKIINPMLLLQVWSTYSKVSSLGTWTPCRLAQCIWWDNWATKYQFRQEFKLSAARTNIVKCNQCLGPSSPVITDCKEDSIPPHGRHQLLNEERQKRPTDNRQVKVVYHEKAVEVQRRPVLHQFSTCEDSNVVCREQRHRRLQGRNGRLPRFESEFCGRIAHHRSI